MFPVRLSDCVTVTELPSSLPASKETICYSSNVVLQEVTSVSKEVYPIKLISFISWFMPSQYANE